MKNNARLAVLSLAWLAASAAPALAQSLIAGLPTVDGAVNDMYVDGTTLYLAGGFNTVGGQTRHGFASIDLTNNTVNAWDPSGANSNSGTTVQVAGSTVYVGGIFSTIGGQSRSTVAAVNNTSGTATAWDAGINNGFQLKSLRVDGSGNVYLWGDFTMVQSTARHTLAAVDSSGALLAFDPNPVGSTIENNYRDMAILSGNVYLAHGNTNGSWNGGADNRRGLSVVDATTGALTSGNLIPQDGVFGAGTFGLQVSGTDIYVSGSFANVMSADPGNAPGTLRQKVLKLDASSFTLDPTFAPTAVTGPDSGTRHMALINGVLYAIGDFNNYGGNPVKGVAAINPDDASLITTWLVTTDGSHTFSGASSRIAAGNGMLFLASPSMFDWTVLGVDHQNYLVGVTLAAVPEPAVTALLIGLATLLAVRRRR